MSDMRKKSDDYWRKKLSPDSYRITREKGTETPFSGKYVNNHETGMYQCIACGQELFSSRAKFDSHSGWPSFDRPENLENIELVADNSLGMQRTEVVCKNCGAHLGHLFDDGPNNLPDGSDSTGQRYCINSCALDFKKGETHGS